MRYLPTKLKEKTEMNFETYWQQVTDGISKKGLYTFDAVKGLVKVAFEIGRDYGGVRDAGLTNDTILKLQNQNVRLATNIADMLEHVDTTRRDYANSDLLSRTAYAAEVLAILHNRLREIANR